MIVRFYELTIDGTATVGDITLKNGVLTAEPATRQAMINLMTEDFELWDPKTGEREFINPHAEPERFLKGCLDTFRGTYLWCKEFKG